MIYSDCVTPLAALGLSTHVLNTATGDPAADMKVRFQSLEGGVWIDRHESRTNADGRAHGFSKGPLGAGNFRLIFDAGSWFAQRGQDCFFPQVTIEFKANDSNRHHHVPLLLSPFGYSTYRGS